MWFAGNSVIGDLVLSFGIPETSLGILTSAVQFGFILGTLSFAAMTIADRFSPSYVFMVCGCIAAVCNLGILWEDNTLNSLLLFRFGTGFFLAGIYPVGMKIAADYFDTGLGKSLGFLVGALVLGTAFPHGLNSLGLSFNWHYIIISTSAIAVIGALFIGVFIPNGPFRKASQQLKLTAFFTVFKEVAFRKAAFGYFGHMWELYAFWAFVPFIITAFNKVNNVSLHVSTYSFLIIAIGSLGCIVAGKVSNKFGAKKVARISLLISGACCVLSVVAFEFSVFWFLAFLLLWGFTVIADSPLFSTLVAQNATPELKGSALTIVNCIGFAISIVSIQLVAFISEIVLPQYIFIVLFLGPLFGLFHLRNKQQ